MATENALARIRFVTERYEDLQGLRLTVIGFALTLVFGTYLVAGPQTERGLIIALVLAFAVTLPCIVFVERYYRAVFGRARAATGPQARQNWVVGIGVGLPIVAAAYRGTSSESTAILLPVLVFAVQSIWIVIRDWPLRRYHAFGAVICLLIVGYGYSPGNDTNLAFVLTAGYALTGAIYAIVGFRDHRMVADTLRPSDPPASPDEVSRPEPFRL